MPIMSAWTRSHLLLLSLLLIWFVPFRLLHSRTSLGDNAWCDARARWTFFWAIYRVAPRTVNICQTLTPLEKKFALNVCEGKVSNIKSNSCGKRKLRERRTLSWMCETRRLVGVALDARQSFVHKCRRASSRRSQWDGMHSVRQSSAPWARYKRCSSSKINIVVCSIRSLASIWYTAHGSVPSTFSLGLTERVVSECECECGFVSLCMSRSRLQKYSTFVCRFSGCLFLSL